MLISQFVPAPATFVHLMLLYILVHMLVHLLVRSCSACSGSINHAQSLLQNPHLSPSDRQLWFLFHKFVLLLHIEGRLLQV
jgi:hypothetical protein